MALNQCNNGTLVGNLAKDPVVFDNTDGSKKVILTVAAQRNYKDKKTGKREADFVTVERFVPANQKMGVFDYCKKGQGVIVTYTVQPQSYEKNGETVYEQKLVISDVTLLGSPRGKSGSAENAAQAGEVVPADLIAEGIEVPALAD